MDRLHIASAVLLCTSTNEGCVYIVQKVSQRNLAWRFDAVAAAFDGSQSPSLGVIPARETERVQTRTTHY